MVAHRDDAARAGGPAEHLFVKSGLSGIGGTGDIEIDDGSGHTPGCLLCCGIGRKQGSGERTREYEAERKTRNDHAITSWWLGSATARPAWLEKTGARGAMVGAVSSPSASRRF